MPAREQGASGRGEGLDEGSDLRRLARKIHEELAGADQAVEIV
jgi:hypothetical protein